MADDFEIVLGVLNAVHQNASVTQRSVAQDLGIALGLANAYLKRLVRKGFIKISHVPRNRYTYYVTPQGFAEKSRLTAQFISQSFTFFRVARQECTQLLRQAAAQGWREVVLVGGGDLAAVAVLCAREVEDIELVGVIGPENGKDPFFGLPIFGDLDRAADFSAVLITDMRHGQDAHDRLAKLMPSDRILAPRFLHIIAATPAVETGVMA